MGGTSPAMTRAAMRSRRGGRNFRGLRKLGERALLIVDQQEQIEIADGRRAAGAFDDRLPPGVVMRLLRMLQRRPQIDAAAGLAVEFEQEMLAQQLLVGLPMRNDV